MLSSRTLIRQYWKPVLASALFALGASGCAGLPDTQGRARSVAPPPSKHTALARTIRPLVAAHPGQTGAYMLSNGQDAFAARLALVDAAERTLDLQYFIWKKDVTGQILLDRLLRAADRGVKVRLLIDDLGTMPSDKTLVALGTHPNIQVRLFNPVRLRSAKLLGMLFEVGRINRRMHNKSFIADGQVAILGGRNIGDEYFAADHEMNFSDLDVVTIGPVVKEVSEAFDLYWNCPAALAITDLSSHQPAPKDLAQIRNALNLYDTQMQSSPYARSLQECLLAAQLRNHSVAYAWGRGRVICDSPDKIISGKADSPGDVGPQLRAIAEAAQKEVYVVSPYFIPRKGGVDLLTGIHARGPRVVVVTNSLASTDGLAAFSGYQPYRQALLRGGIELYELKAKPGDTSRRIRWWSSPGSGSSGLHAKTFSFDRRTLFVGSFNFDPRSRNLNTEIGVLLDTPVLATRLPKTLDRDMHTEAYRVTLVNDRLVWTTQENGREVHYGNEPATNFSRRMKTAILGWLPIEKQL
jgi:putative cardiolipin synthase